MSAFRNAMINIHSQDVARLAGFYERPGFRGTFRTPERGAPIHVELSLGQFKIGIASVDAAIAEHGLNPDLGGRPVEIVRWTYDTEHDYTPDRRRRALPQPAA
jgi:lactoylglutathione lyase